MCIRDRYKQICKQYKCKAKVFTKMKTDLKNKIGSPDLLILFTSTVSHKMVPVSYTHLSAAAGNIFRSEYV